MASPFFRFDETFGFEGFLKLEGNEGFLMLEEILEGKMRMTEYS